MIPTLDSHLEWSRLGQAAVADALRFRRYACAGDARRQIAPLFYHGSRANLQTGHMIAPGYRSNYGTRRVSKWVYFSATLDAAIWGAELAQGDARQRVYIVEPTGAFEDDPNLTDKRFPGNPTRSYRTAAPLRVVGEVEEWAGHPPERLEQMQAFLEDLKCKGIEAIED